MPTVVTNLIFSFVAYLNVDFFPVLFDIMNCMPMFREFRDSDHLLLQWREIINYTPLGFFGVALLL